MNTFNRNIRQVFEGMAPAEQSPEARMEGARRFRDHIWGALGLKIGVTGVPVLETAAAKFSPHEFSLAGLANALLGEAWYDALRTGMGQTMRVFESGSVGNVAMTPANIPNVSAFLGSVTGLLNAGMLAGYQQPEYIIDKLVHTIPSSTRQQNLLGLGEIGDQAGSRNPGDGHPFANFGERVVRTSETTQRALAMALTFEMVKFDQTGQALQQAGKVGQSLALNKEKAGFRRIAGIVNPYNYNGVSYNTYLTSGNWINKITSNPLNDWTALDAARAVASRLTDQETGERITVSFDTLIVAPANEWTAKHIKAQTEIATFTQSAAQERRGQYLGDKYNLVSSPILDALLTASAASGGAAVSQTVADGRWYKLKTGVQGAFVRTENWGLDIQQAAPNDFAMLNQKLILAVFANEMDAFDVLEPRHVQQNDA